MTEVWVTEQSGFFEKWATEQFRKIAYRVVFSTFFVILCIITQLNLQLSQNWAIFTRFRNFSKFSGPAAPKMDHLNHFSQKIPKVPIFRRRKMDHWMAKFTPPPLVGQPPPPRIRSLLQKMEDYVSSKIHLSQRSKKPHFAISMKNPPTLVSVLKPLDPGRQKIPQNVSNKMLKTMKQNLFLQKSSRTLFK